MERSKKEQLKIAFKQILDKFVEKTHGAYTEWEGCDEDTNGTVNELLKEVTIRTRIA